MYVGFQSNEYLKNRVFKGCRFLIDLDGKTKLIHFYKMKELLIDKKVKFLRIYLRVEIKV